ncbi:hypothetical protein ABZU75_02985 [Streptosporangium sp. NPDC005286]|uniref:hypothetical protein n=1 Tax=Streptosporangium sp. NPDC005286 TaxID=3154463 RepID=UPI00339FAFD4
MGTEPLRLVCAAFFLHYLGVGLLPDGGESWLENNQWLMWTAAVLTVASAVASAVAVPLFSLTARRPGEDR